ncbi:MAG TPA: lysophospholipid acyltransferase family protein [Pyrinomonadaceae bacterium]|nr:lysophospholipid acyltransferase family protein [Pyrinomonadaceae bacterium]
MTDEQLSVTGSRAAGEEASEPTRVASPFEGGRALRADSGRVVSSVAPVESNTAAPAGSLAGRLHYWWSLFVAAALLLIVGPPTIIVCYLANRRHWLYPWARFGARNWLRLSGVRVRVRGRENLEPGRTYIFAANHRSFLDTAALFYEAGRDRRVGVLAKKELLKVPILGYGMSYVNIMAIDRSNRERAFETVRAATERIKSGISFVVFAEGTRALPGRLLPFKKGAFYMASDAGVPIVPVAVKNTDALMGKGTGVARPGTMEIVFLPPVETSDGADGEPPDERVKRLVARVHSMVAEELGKK